MPITGETIHKTAVKLARGFYSTLEVSDQRYEASVANPFSLAE